MVWCLYLGVERWVESRQGGETRTRMMIMMLGCRRSRGGRGRGCFGRELVLLLLLLVLLVVVVILLLLLS